MKRLVHTRNDAVAMLLRLTLGIVMFPHGAQKLLGWFGGQGFSASMATFEQMGIPGFFGFLAIVTEFFGSLALIFGVFTRVAAFAVAVEMIVAVGMFHLSNGFFMNWLGTQKGEGFEYHLLLWGVATAVMIRGAGRASVDLKLTESFETPKQESSRFAA